MNKKITAVTLTALMVLTMFTAMVPAASAAKQVEVPYEFMGAVGDIPGWINLTSHNNSGILFYDIDEKDGAETLDMYIGTNLDIDAANFTYTTTIYETDEGDANVAWLGAAYYVVANDTSEWWISEKLLDEDEDDEYLLMVGESLSLAEGMSLSVLEIDVDGEEAWITISQDGEELGSEVVSTSDDNPYFIFEADLDDDGDEDDEVINLTVETVFAGMNTNLVKINDIDLVSMDVLLIEDDDTDLFSDFEINLGTDPTLTIELEDSDDEISLTSDGVKDVFGDSISVRINDEDDYAAVVKEVIVGGGAVATEAPTAVGTEVATDEPTNETGVEPGAPTEGPTADTGETEVPTEVPTEDEVPGFEAVFAIAGLLAVAYLVLRQRE
jgi:S-layer protein (TIGR01567 family)